MMQIINNRQLSPPGKGCKTFHQTEGPSYGTEMPEKDVKLFTFEGEKPINLREIIQQP